MYAVVRAGGKQYRVAPGDVIKVDANLAGDSGKVEFPATDVLAVSASAGEIVQPNGGASVTGEVVDHGRSPKILVFKFKRKKQYKKLTGHRQDFTAVRITEISFNGEKATAPALAPKKAKAPKQEAHAEAEATHEKKAAAPKKKAAAKKPAAKKTAAKKSSKKK